MLRIALVGLLLGGCQVAFGIERVGDAGRVADGAHVADGVVVDAAAPTADARMLPNEVAYYPMDGAASNGCLDDASGHHHAGSCLGNPIGIGPGVIGNAYVFDGGGRIQIASTGDLGGPGAFTFAGWINYTGDANAGMCPFNRVYGDLGENSWQVCFDTANGISFYFATDTGPITHSAPLFGPNGWHHFAITSTGGVVETYVDGARINGSAVNLMFDGGPIEIGADLDPTSVNSWVTGSIDDVWFFDRSLTGLEIAALESP